MLQNIIWVGIGSLAGGISRYLLSDGMYRLFPGLFPWGTFAVNISGCFIIGLLSGCAASASWWHPLHRLVFVTGFCGSFTTFSTFSLDNLNLLASRAYGTFALNAGLSLGIGLLATFIGYSLTRH